jgi:hypothetical protein
MIEKTFAARYSRIRSMMIGLYRHSEEFTPSGASPEFLTELSYLYTEVKRIQKRRRVLQKNSLGATAAKNRSLAQAEKLCGKARKWVRRKLPAEAWPEFGFKKGEYARPKPAPVSKTK